VEARTASGIVHALTAVHATGSAALLAMAVFVLLDPANAEALTATPGARIMVDATGPWLPLVFLLMSAFFGSVAWGSHRHHRWSWPAAVVAYTIGVLGSAWQISVGIIGGWVALAVNGLVVVALWLPAVRQRFRGRGDGAAD
jgi:hypothetical protein